MNLMEGANRIQRVGRILWITSFCFGIGGLLDIAIFAIVPRYTTNTIILFPSYGIFLVIAQYSFLLGGGFWVLGWIVKGFAEPES
jgi:hypothetical protein